MKNNILSDDEIVRWACLFECLALITDKCKKYNLDHDLVLNKKLKPNHIQGYIDSRFPVLCNSIETGSYSGDFITKFLYNGKD